MAGVSEEAKPAVLEGAELAPLQFQSPLCGHSISQVPQMDQSRAEGVASKRRLFGRRERFSDSLHSFPISLPLFAWE